MRYKELELGLESLQLMPKLVLPGTIYEGKDSQGQAPQFCTLLEVIIQWTQNQGTSGAEGRLEYGPELIHSPPLPSPGPWVKESADFWPSHVSSCSWVMKPRNCVWKVLGFAHGFRASLIVAEPSCVDSQGMMKKSTPKQQHQVMWLPLKSHSSSFSEWLRRESPKNRRNVLQRTESYCRTSKWCQPFHDSAHSLYSRCLCQSISLNDAHYMLVALFLEFIIQSQLLLGQCPLRSNLMCLPCLADIWKSEFFCLAVQRTLLEELLHILIGNSFWCFLFLPSQSFSFSKKRAWYYLIQAVSPGIKKVFN